MLRDTIIRNLVDAGFDWKGQWLDGTTYVINDLVQNNGNVYICTAGHSADSTNEPGVGINWNLYWDLFISGTSGTSGSSGSSGTSGIGGISEVSDDHSPQLGGDLDLNDYYIKMDSSPPSDSTGSGFISVEAIDTNDIGIGALLYLNTDGNYDMADATSSITIDKKLVLALEEGTGSKKVLNIGFMRNDSWNWSLIGSAVYASTTPGELTQTAPSNSGDQVRRVGFATHSNRIWFNPSNDIIEI